MPMVHLGTNSSIYWQVDGTTSDHNITNEGTDNEKKSP